MARRLPTLQDLWKRRFFDAGSQCHVGAGVGAFTTNAITAIPAGSSPRHGGHPPPQSISDLTVPLPDSGGTRYCPPTHTHPVKATEKAQRSLGWTALKKNHTQDHPTNSPYPRSTQPLPDMPTAGKADLRGTHLSPSAGCHSRSREQD